MRLGVDGRIVRPGGRWGRVGRGSEPWNASTDAHAGSSTSRWGYSGCRKVSLRHVQEHGVASLRPAKGHCAFQAPGSSQI